MMQQLQQAAPPPSYPMPIQQQTASSQPPEPMDDLPSGTVVSSANQMLNNTYY